MQKDSLGAIFVLNFKMTPLFSQMEATACKPETFHDHSLSE